MSRRAGICLALAAFLQMGPPTLRSGAPAIQSDLDRIFSDPLLARAIVGARIESLRLLFSLGAFGWLVLRR